MFKIESPVKGYSGLGYGLTFADGVALCVDEALAKRLEKKGYKVTAQSDTGGKGQTKKSAKPKGKGKDKDEPPEQPSGTEEKPAMDGDETPENDGEGGPPENPENGEGGQTEAAEGT